MKKYLTAHAIFLAILFFSMNVQLSETFVPCRLTGVGLLNHEARRHKEYTKKN